MEALIVSNVLLWLLLIATAVALLGLIRQIGVLHSRVAPAGALMMDKGVAAGQPAPQITAADRSGKPINIGYASEKSTLLFFLSTSCPICKSLLPAIKAIDKSTNDLDVIYVGDGDAAEHDALIAKEGLKASNYILSPEVGMTFQIGKLPYAVLIDKSGTLKSKGLVNSREHLDSLFETELLGSASLQEYIKTQTESPGIHTPS